MILEILLGLSSGISQCGPVIEQCYPAGLKRGLPVLPEETPRFTMVAGRSHRHVAYLDGRDPISRQEVRHLLTDVGITFFFKFEPSTGESFPFSPGKTWILTSPGLAVKARRTLVNCKSLNGFVGTSIEPARVLWTQRVRSKELKWPVKGSEGLCGVNVGLLKEVVEKVAKEESEGVANAQVNRIRLVRRVVPLQRAVAIDLGIEFKGDYGKRRHRCRRVQYSEGGKLLLSEVNDGLFVVRRTEIDRGFEFIVGPAQWPPK